MTNPVKVQHFPRNVVPTTLHSGLTQNKFVTSRETRGGHPALVKIHSFNREGIMEVLLSQGFDPDTSDILRPSWRQGTINYSQFISEWFTISKMNNISLVEPPIQVAFLTSLVKKGKPNNQICTARSVLASVITPQNNFSFANLPNVKRYTKRVFEKNPTLAKYHYMWNVSMPVVE